MDMGRQLDFNHELMTVGISNLLSGLTGGFTGSYIFSQTLFTFRTGTRSRICGGLVLVTQFLLFLAPFSVVSFVPKLFFGAVLTFIAADLMLDWLFLSRNKVRHTPHATRHTPRRDDATTPRRHDATRHKPHRHPPHASPPS